LLEEIRAIQRWRRLGAAGSQGPKDDRWAGSEADFLRVTEAQPRGLHTGSLAREPEAATKFMRGTPSHHPKHGVNDDLWILPALDTHGLAQTDNSVSTSAADARPSPTRLGSAQSKV